MKKYIENYHVLFDKFVKFSNRTPFHIEKSRKRDIENPILHFFVEM